MSQQKVVQNLDRKSIDNHVWSHIESKHEGEGILLQVDTDVEPHLERSFEF